MADNADIAENEIERGTQRAIDSILNRNTERPEYNDEGDRICLDCAAVIPEARIKAVGAVRCIYCAQADEDEKKMYN